MCKYCEQELSVIERHADVQISCDIDSRNKIVHFSKWNLKGGDIELNKIHIPIKYCPMCGSKL